MPRLKSWGGGGYKRSSMSKRVRDILGLTTGRADSSGLDRFGHVHDPFSLRVWNYLPEGPWVTGIFNIHHQYDFTLAGDVDATQTWDETSLGGNRMPLLIDTRYGLPHGSFRSGNADGDYT